jgi:hypothetical protein
MRRGEDSSRNTGIINPMLLYDGKKKKIQVQEN